MNKQNEPHHHHFAPQGFLKQWAQQDGWIWRSRRISYNGKFETTRQNSTSSIGWDKNIYNITQGFRNSKIINLMIEFIASRNYVANDFGYNFETTIFQKVDNDGIASYKKIEEGADLYSLSSVDRESFLKFTYLLQARNPVFLRTMSDVWNNEFKENFRSEFKDVVGLNFEELTQEGNAGKLALLDIALDKSIINELYADVRTFTMDFDLEPFYFITGDYPYVAMPDIKSREALHVFPLSPKKCLVMGRDNDHFWHMKKGLLNPINREASVDVINYIVAAYAGEAYSWYGNIPVDLSDTLGVFKRDKEMAQNLFSYKLKKLDFR